MFSPYLVRTYWLIIPRPIHFIQFSLYAVLYILFLSMNKITMFKTRNHFDIPIEPPPNEMKLYHEIKAYHRNSPSRVKHDFTK